jgi:hypothetical protein
MKKQLAFLAFFILPCVAMPLAAQEELVTGKVYNYSLQSFEVDFPQSYLGKETKWKLVSIDEQYDAIEFYVERNPAWTKGKMAFSFRIFSNPILSDSIRGLTNEAIANDFRNSEVKDMKEMGREMYKLEDLRMYTDSLGGRLYYVLSYANRFYTGYVLEGWLYIHLPREKGNEAIFCGLHAELMRDFDYHKNYKPQQMGCLLVMLENARLK